MHTEQISSDHIFNSSHIGLVVTNAGGLIVKVNKHAAQILGIRGEAIQNQFISEALPSIGSRIEKALASGRNAMGLEIVEKGVRLLLNITLIQDQDSSLGAVANFHERAFIEELAKKFEFYKLQNNELNAIFQSVHDALWVCDGKGKVLNINRASEKLNQINREDVIGTRVDELVSQGMFDKSVTSQVLARKKQVTIVQEIRKTGVKILATGTPVFNETGDISLVVVNSRDLTSLNFIRDELEKSREESDRLRDALQEMALEKSKKQAVVGSSQAIQSVLKVALKLSRMDVSNILLLGESGTGKGLMAKFIHNSSARKDNTFMQINCAALPENLLEAELFGYEKGAFTGAKSKGKIGLIEISENGTLFLDEIGELPLALQSKLLKYFDDREVMRLGATSSRKVDCAIVAATNRDLNALVEQGQFRQDLFYRINTFTLTIPPLRERSEDILDITNHFLSRYNSRYKTRKRIGFEVFRQIQQYPFPGNIRELKNIIKKGVVLSDSPDLDPFLVKELNLASPEELPLGREDDFDLKAALLAYERKILVQVMKTEKTTRKMARKLGLNHSTVVRKLKKHQLSTTGAV